VHQNGNPASGGVLLSLVVVPRMETSGDARSVLQRPQPSTTRWSVADRTWATHFLRSPRLTALSQRERGVLRRRLEPNGPSTNDATRASLRAGTSVGNRAASIARLGTGRPSISSVATCGRQRRSARRTPAVPAREAGQARRPQPSGPAAR